MSADPPWLDEVIQRAQAAWHNGPRDVVSVVLAFAARQPLPITDAMVDAARQAMPEHAPTRAFMRAAIEAYEKARAAG